MTKSIFLTGILLQPAPPIDFSAANGKPVAFPLSLYRKQRKREPLHPEEIEHWLVSLKLTVKNSAAENWEEKKLWTNRSVFLKPETSEQKELGKRLEKMKRLWTSSTNKNSVWRALVQEGLAPMV